MKPAVKPPSRIAAKEVPRRMLNHPAFLDMYAAVPETLRPCTCWCTMIDSEGPEIRPAERPRQTDRQTHQPAEMRECGQEQRPESASASKVMNEQQNQKKRTTEQQQSLGNM